YPKVHDFSVNYELTANGKLVEFEPRFFKIDSHFQYQGAFLGRNRSDPAYQKSQRLIELQRPFWRSEHERVIEHLRSLNYVGPFGIDALIYQTASVELAIAPLIEVNVRTTMGRVALEIERALASKHPKLDGYWVFLNQKDVIALGARNFKELEVKLRAELGDKLIVTSPSHAEFTWTFAVLDHSLMDRFFKTC
ncbi:MAG: hypothetical protein H7333_09030, partial [Bdellovibrionales bacterium]|nr:hypothetical protein [Oligoflexia bacterium]